MDPIVIAENASEIGADLATSSVPAGYQGRCAVIEESGSGRVVAVLPCRAEAHRVARYAISPSGGYGSVSVETTERAVTHPTLEAWL